jgi:hypothetical protein
VTAAIFDFTAIAKRARELGVIEPQADEERADPQSVDPQPSVGYWNQTVSSVTDGVAESEPGIYVVPEDFDWSGAGHFRLRNSRGEIDVAVYPEGFVIATFKRLRG